ncbi:MAG: cytochrome P450 [Bacteroidota bacterium]
MEKINTIPRASFLEFLRRSPEIVKNPLPFHHDNFEKNGDTFLLNLRFGNRIVFSRDAAFLKYALQTNQRNYTKSTVQTKEVAKYIGKGLLTSEGALWKRQRKLIQPSFHKKYLGQLVKIMKRTVLDELSKIPIGETIDVEPYFGSLAFQVVGKSLFSGAVNEKTILQLQKIVEASQRMLVRELRQPYLGWWFKYGGLLDKHFAMVQEARELVRGIITSRKKEGADRGDLLDLLLESRYEDGTPMEEEQMIDEIMILFTAGHETTSNALTFTCQLLAKNPEYQDRISEEAQASKGEDGLAEIMGLKVTTQVLEEAMRLYPPAYFIDRMNVQEDSFNGFQLPAKTTLLFSAIEIHRHRAHWEAPMAFVPERFDGPPNQHSDYYFPFGAGPRRCIGNNFAMMEMLLVISNLMKHRSIRPNANPIKILPLITLRPKEAYVTFEKRTSQI